MPKKNRVAPRTTGIFLMICLLLSLSTFSLHAGPAHETAACWTVLESPPTEC
jgi:hypothetical protein